ncbi:MAG TPA: isoleucine--tRNA ligase [Chloroflexota bacterium]|nr:isoleucine--tRNA ligase [Chloroflexota bacterium]
MFPSVPRDFDVPGLERQVLDFWRENDVERRYLERNADSPERFSFLDGPITANGQMGVHHAWGRTYKDLWQRYNTMLGKRQRYQNGFDGQGLWVEVTLERALGFTSKRDIEDFGIAEFVRGCKQSVFEFADTITQQSQRLGYFMDWPNSYYTLSDQNNYAIWAFLKRCHERGLLYEGNDVMPWCTGCGTGISEMEAAEGYQTLKHKSVYVAFPLLGTPGESLLVWTTTPWTLTSNVAVAVNPDLTYVRVRQGDDIYYLAEQRLSVLRGEYDRLGEMPGSEMVGWRFRGPFDELPVAHGIQHTVIPWEDVSADEGTGLVHIAPGCGAEDFALSKQFGLPVIAPINESGIYGEGFGPLAGRDVLTVGDDIISDLKRKGLLYRTETIEHRYPTCWRSGHELVFRLVDEWFISMGPLREPMMDVARQIHWLPPYGLERELDWLRNMGDWMISKKRYWGLALPFWICPDGHLTVVGGKEELFERAVSGLDGLESPHRPWIDDVTIRCGQCDKVAERIPDVGNVWLDAGIVPYSTMGYFDDRSYWQDWFPAQFITESFPGQFRNWFYSMLAMSTVLENAAPFETVLGYALMRDQDGREMHKSWGNLIPFDEAADRAGADVMRWLFVLHDPERNLNFGWQSLDEIKRRLLTLWNTYSFFVTYANVDGWSPEQGALPPAERPLLDRWLLARLNVLIGDVRTGLDRYDAAHSAGAIDAFIEDMSTWYVRRSRRRFWRSESDADKLAAYASLYEALTILAQLIAPFMPFLSEYLYQQLVRPANPDVALSVHLTDYPQADHALIDHALLDAMTAAQKVVALGRAARDKSTIRVRQPLAAMFVKTPTPETAGDVQTLCDIILDELNVKNLEFAGTAEEYMEYSVRPNLPVLGPKYGKQVGAIRQALSELDPAEVTRQVESGLPVVVSADGHLVELLPDEILTGARERAGFAAMAADGYLVALDTTLTPDLVAEGWAREVIRRVNDWRRAAGFNVDDRITIRYEASDPLADAIRAHRGYIAAETLTEDLQEAEPANGYIGEADFAGQWLKASLARVKTPITAS